MRAGRGNAFVFVKDLGRRAQHLLQPHRAAQRARPPQGIDLAHLVGNLDPALGGHLLLQHRAGEDCQHLLRADRLAIRSEGRCRRVLQVGGDVVPVSRDFVLVENDAGLAHGFLPEDFDMGAYGSADSMFVTASGSCSARSPRIMSRRLILSGFNSLRRAS